MSIFRYLGIFLCLTSMAVHAQSVERQASLMPGLHTVDKILQLQPGSSVSCQHVFNGFKLPVRLTYYEIVNLLQEDGFALLDNTSDGIGPITSELSAQGFSDRTAFAHYYNPSMTLIYQHKRAIGLYAIIFNICNDGDKQAAVEIYLTPTHEACLLTTPAWNGCR